MKNKYTIITALLFGAILSTSFKSQTFTEVTGNECDVVAFYKAIQPEANVKVLTSTGNLEDAELILVPTRIDEGNYNIEITRKGSNLYKLESTELYIETRYCYEYSMYEDAILKVESNYGYTKGTIYFD
jgi:hypothetical protein